MDELTPQLKQLMENARGVVLSRTEKERMRAEIAGHIRLNPKRGGLIPSPWATGRFLMMMHKPVALMLIVILGLGSGTVYAAEGALPGDTLYAIKVAVVEEAIAAVSVSDEGRARWDARRAERRLEEAVALREEGRLDTETGIELENSFERFADAAEARIVRVEEKRGPGAAAILLAEFEGKLRTHDERFALATKDAEESMQQRGEEQMVRMASKTVAPELPQPETAATMVMTEPVQHEDAGVTAIAASRAAETPPAPPARKIFQKEEKREHEITRKVKERIEKIERVRIEAERKAEERRERDDTVSEGRGSAGEDLVVGAHADEDEDTRDDDSRKRRRGRAHKD